MAVTTPVTKITPLMPNTPKTAAKRQIFAPDARHIPHDDDALILEALRIAQGELVRQSREVERVWPGTELAERLALFAEKMADLRDKLDGRESEAV